MTDKEWESLCDGCARCCLLKLQDEDTDALYFTNVSCHLLNIEQCRCADYQHRLQKVSQCMDIRQMKPSEYAWLPETCAYRLLAENKPLAEWHPLMSNDPQSVKIAGIAVDGFAQSEVNIHEDQLEDHIINLLDEC